jgi:hypothetical protein
MYNFFERTTVLWSAVVFITTTAKTGEIHKIWYWKRSTVPSFVRADTRLAVKVLVVAFLLGSDTYHAKQQITRTRPITGGSTSSNLACLSSFHHLGGSEMPAQDKTLYPQIVHSPFCKQGPDILCDIIYMGSI